MGEEQKKFQAGDKVRVIDAGPNDGLIPLVGEVVTVSAVEPGIFTDQYVYIEGVEGGPFFSERFEKAVEPPAAKPTPRILFRDNATGYCADTLDLFVTGTEVSVYVLDGVGTVKQGERYVEEK